MLLANHLINSNDSSNYFYHILFKSQNYISTNLKERHNIIRPLKNANFKRDEVKRLGFNVSNNLWRTCNNKEKRNKGNSHPSK